MSKNIRQIGRGAGSGKFLLRTAVALAASASVGSAFAAISITNTPPNLNVNNGVVTISPKVAVDAGETYVANFSFQLSGLSPADYIAIDAGTKSCTFSGAAAVFNGAVGVAPCEISINTAGLATISTAATNGFGSATSTAGDIDFTISYTVPNFTLSHNIDGWTLYGATNSTPQSVGAYKALGLSSVVSASVDPNSTTGKVAFNLGVTNGTTSSIGSYPNEWSFQIANLTQAEFNRINGSFSCIAAGNLGTATGCSVAVTHDDTGNILSAIITPVGGAFPTSLGAGESLEFGIGYEISGSANFVAKNIDYTLTKLTGTVSVTEFSTPASNINTSLIPSAVAGGNTVTLNPAISATNAVTGITGPWRLVFDRLSPAQISQIGSTINCSYTGNNTSIPSGACNASIVSGAIQINTMNSPTAIGAGGNASYTISYTTPSGFDLHVVKYEFGNLDLQGAQTIVGPNSTTGIGLLASPDVSPASDGKVVAKFSLFNGSGAAQAFAPGSFVLGGVNFGAVDGRTCSYVIGTTTSGSCSFTVSPLTGVVSITATPSVPQVGNLETAEFTFNYTVPAGRRAHAFEYSLNGFDGKVEVSEHSGTGVTPSPTGFSVSGPSSTVIPTATGVVSIPVTVRNGTAGALSGVTYGYSGVPAGITVACQRAGGACSASGGAVTGLPGTLNANQEVLYTLSYTVPAGQATHPVTHTVRTSTSGVAAATATTQVATRPAGGGGGVVPAPNTQSIPAVGPLGLAGMSVLAALVPGFVARRRRKAAAAQ